MSSGVSSHNTQQVRALQVYMVDLIATEYEAKCSALIVVVNAQADALTYQLDGEVMAHHGDDG